MWPGRPTSCTVVCGPGSRTRIICNWGPRHGPQTPNSRTRPGVAVSRLGIAPPESSDHRRKVAGRHTRSDIVELWGPRHGPQTPNSRTHPGVAVSRLGIAPPESSDHRPEAAGRHTRSDIVELAALDPTKANAITGLQQNGLSGLGIVEPHRRASEQPEAAG